MNQLVLIKLRLCGVHRQDELGLVEQKTRTKLVPSPRVIAVDLSIVLPLEGRADDDVISDGDCGAVYDRKESGIAESRSAAGKLLKIFKTAESAAMDLRVCSPAAVG